MNVLKSQTLEKSRFEVIVIDNGSTDNINKIREKYPDVIFLNEAREGSYAARNKGILNSKGHVLAFTDSDCIPAEDWLETGLLSLENKLDAGFVAGKVNLFIKDKNDMTCAEIWEMLNMYDQEFY
ncbi:MAG: glycosyltransferase family A protein, partial [Thermodesulfobacteriota bacterium]